MLCLWDKELSADDWVSEREEAMPVELAAEEEASSIADATSDRQIRMRFCVDAEIFDLCAAMVNTFPRRNWCEGLVDSL